jgi:hypothetical protein
MSSQLSVTQVLSQLEARAAFHREREAHHAGQEELHRQEQAGHAAELEKILASLESFRAAASLAVDLVAQTPAAPPNAARPPVESAQSGRLMVSRLIRAAVDDRRDGEPFGASTLAAEVNRRFAGRLRQPLDTRTASDVLRRMSKSRQIHRVRPGKAFAEALYAKGARPEAG